MSHPVICFKKMNFYIFIWITCKFWFKCDQFNSANGTGYAGGMTSCAGGAGGIISCTGVQMVLQVVVVVLVVLHQPFSFTSDGGVT